MKDKKDPSDKWEEHIEKEKKDTVIEKGMGWESIKRKKEICEG